MSNSMPGNEDGMAMKIEGEKRTAKILHTILSIIYVGLMVFTIPYLLMVMVYSNGYVLVLAPLWVIGSIFVSRILINKNKLPLAYLLLITPLILWSLTLRSVFVSVAFWMIASIFASIILFKKNNKPMAYLALSSGLVAFVAGLVWFIWLFFFEPPYTP